ncbi:MAG: hypothetical protein JWM14_848 [Chitinophagaceae bacterium]|nr:hypothetical protein [Chitinophagaceae bacterium]
MNVLSVSEIVKFTKPQYKVNITTGFDTRKLNAVLKMIH